MRLHVAHENLDTTVELIPTHMPRNRHFRSRDGKKVVHERLLVFDAPFRTDVLVKMADLSGMLKKGNPEIDIDIAGKSIKRTTRVVVDKNLIPIYTFKEWDVFERPDGTRQERPHTPIRPTADAAIPVRITDKLLDPMEIASKFVISQSYFLTHTDGVTYKFLYDIAKNLAHAGKFARMQPYDPVTKKPAPLVLHEGAKPFPGVFLEGRIRGEEYCLILHLSEQEMKIPQSPVDDEGGEIE